MIPNEQRERMIRASANGNERFLLSLLDEARSVAVEADRVLRDCEKNVDMNFKPECYVLCEPEPCGPCQVRAVLIGYEKEVD